MAALAPKVWVPGCDRIGGERARQGQGRFSGSQRIGEGGVIALRNRSGGVNERSQFCLDELAVAGPNHGLAVTGGAVSESNTRSKLGLIRIVQVLRQSRLRRRYDRSRVRSIARKERF